MTTPLARLLARIGAIRVLVAALPEADRAALMARATTAAAMAHVADVGVREAAFLAADETIRSRRDVRRRNVAAEMRRSGEALQLHAAAAARMLHALADTIARDDTFLVADAALFEAERSDPLREDADA